MKIAYLILAHRYPEQLIRLVQKLSTAQNSFFIHIDKKADEKIYHQIVQGLARIPHVYFLRRHRCYWGDFSIVNATIEGLQEIFQKNINFDYIILLSGQDYPIKANHQIVEFLCKNKGKSFVDYFPLPQPNNLPTKWPHGGFERIKYWHFRLWNWRFVFPAKLWLNTYNYSRIKQDFKFRIASKLWFALVFWFPIQRKFPQGFKPFAGSQFWGLSKECAEYVHKFIQDHPKFVRFFRYVDVPDEFFFQTIILNSKFKDTIVNDSLKYMDWENPNPDIPAILEKKDFEDLRSSSKLFARKFDANRDSEILDWIDQKILTCDNLSVR